VKKKPLYVLLKEQYKEIPEKEIYARILCGEVFVNDERERDPKRLYQAESKIRIKNEGRFVSRGGTKLDGVFNEMSLDCKDMVFIDCGASTGGFTDCLLQRGARKIYAVDVGYSQFDFRLRKDPRVVVFERTNILSLSLKNFNEFPQAAVIDLSFRSLRSIAAHILSLVSGEWALSLVKPQFEWKNPPDSFNGIVQSSDDHRAILEELERDLKMEKVFVHDVAKSTIKGKKGNMEFFFLLSKKQNQDDELFKKKLNLIFI
jgi:23S rRNA (cytidine1920-2'-O)/16S rRNA (cytidine1409-2'-O)-methyltransferase